MEFWQWVEYRKKHGPLDPMRRQYEQLAMLTFQVHRGNGGKADMKDFLLYTDREEASEEATAENVAKAFGAVVTTKKFKRS